MCIRDSLYTMKNIIKIKIKVNGKVKLIKNNTKLSNLIKFLKIPIKKVAIELNQEIVDKKKLEKIIFTNAPNPNP